LKDTHARLDEDHDCRIGKGYLFILIARSS
jgi:hypothetical protein